jgi:hypothetical protein
MSNLIYPFMAKVVAESGAYNAAKVGSLQFLEGVYKDINNQVGSAGQAIQVYFPDTGQWTDQQANDWTPQDINLGYKTLTLNERGGYSVLIRGFEQWLSSVNIADVILDPILKRGMEYINGRIASLMTTTRFNAYSPIISSRTPTVINASVPGNGSYIDVPDMANAWAILSGNKVPVDNPDDIALFTHNDVHANMMITPSYVQESLVGAMISMRAREGADIGAPFKFSKRWDQQCGRANSKGVGPALTGTGFASSGAVVTGTGSKFLSQLEVGDTFTTNTSGAVDINRVTVVTDDTHVTLAATPATTISATTATKVGYTSLAMHKYGIAFAARPLEMVNTGELMQSRLLKLAGIPFRVQLSYQHGKGSSWLLTSDIGMAVDVLRPDFGVIIKS